MTPASHEPVRLDDPKDLTAASTRLHPTTPVPARLALLAALLLAGACRGDAPLPEESVPPTFVIAGIPDQEVSRLERMFGLLAEHLEERLGFPVRYVAANDYAAVVSAFQRGDVHLAWLGGLTGVQARALTPGAEPVAQRPRDAEFRSVFLVGRDVTAEGLADLAGRSFTFGSESSTSGHLMPRFFLGEAGVDPDTRFRGPPGHAASHDATWKLVEAGAYEAGVLNVSVWEAAVREGRVDTTRVRVLELTPPFFDYNWSIRGDVDERFGAGTRARVLEALYELHPSQGPEEAELLALFQTDRFVPTSERNYDAIRAVAERLGILR